MTSWSKAPGLRRALLAVAAVVVVVVLVRLLDVAGAFGTRGLIFIGSPEVYTRERLVNDRYDQDFWLHSQMDLLDKSDALVTAFVRQAISGGATANISTQEPAPPADIPSGGAAAATVEAPDGIAVRMPFDQEFLIRAGVRDAIRQLILENLLDDRHDLTGNSVYGLKFDMTVVAGSRTYESAFARVSVKAKALFDNAETSATDGPAPAAGAETPEIDLPLHVKQYYERDIFDIEQNEKDPLYTSYSLYNKWIADVDARLNTYEIQIYDVLGKVFAPCDTSGARVEWERRVLRAANDVLGLSNATIAADVGIDGTREILLPSPWRDHLRVLVTLFNDTDCQATPIFRVDPIWDPIYLIEGTYTGNEYMLVDAVDATTSAYVSSKGYTDVGNIDSHVYEQLRPHYRRIGALANYVKNFSTRKGAIQSFTVPGPDKKPMKVETILVPSGYFNFIESVFRTDAYTYALFPKSEIWGVLAEQNLDLAGSISGALGGAGSGGANLSVSTGEKSFQAAPRTVGFADATPGGTVDFGWVISGRGALQSTQKSGLALVSVPAWTNELAVHVDTGWVDDRGEMTTTRSYDFPVPIPPDYEAFDAFVGGSRIRHEPRISNDLMGWPQPIEACDDVSIIIPGFRLWRSTVVTLGGETAKRIMVLPNMRGVVAKFENLFATSVPRTETMAKLRVWTSEGVDTAARDVQILPPHEGAACLTDGKGSGDDGPGNVAAGTGAADRLGGN